MEREAILKEEISQRLRRALERAGDRSMRSLESAMAERGSDITSYGAIRSYVQGEKLPPLTFLLEAADELSVRPEWLVLGEGEMTEVEEQLTEEEAIEHLLATHPEMEAWPRRAREVFVEVLGSYILQTPDHEELAGTNVGAETWLELERDLVFLVTLPLRSWGFRAMEDLSQRERFAYLLSALNSLLVAVPGVGEGDALADHVQSLLPKLRRADGRSGELTGAERERARRLDQVLKQEGDCK